VAQVSVDTGLVHLDRPFDYAVPAAMADGAQPGCRVRVRFAGRLVDGLVLARASTSEHASLSPLTSLVSPEPVLSPEIADLARAVADRAAGSLYDVLRLAIPPRHGRVEAQEPTPVEQSAPTRPEPGPWARYTDGATFLDALAAGRSPRAVWSALPGPDWPIEVAIAVRTCVAAGRGAVVVVPDARDLTRVSDALADLSHAALSADLGPAERYRRWLSVRRGQVRVAVGTRGAVFAPVSDLGLVVIWDDGDDLHAEPRSPYVHARDVLVQRAHRTGAAMLLGGHARTAEAQQLVDSGWARSLEAPRATVRALAPRVDGVSDDDLARDPQARAARLPGKAFEAARESLAAGAPVLIQVPRRGYTPGLACARDRTPARCATCSGPVSAGSDQRTACAWCGRPAADWTCPQCSGRALRATVVGARRTAEELGRAFPGTPVRTSGRDEVLATVAGTPALVVATPGAEPVADGGYGAVLLLDGWALLGRADLRAGEEALRRWFAAAALARPGARAIVVADRGLIPVQALTRWDPSGAAARELADRAAVGFPPAVRMAALQGPAAAVAELLAGLELPGSADLLGPVAAGDEERVLIRVPRADGARLAEALKAGIAVRSARKSEHVRVVLDPQSLA